MRNSLWLRIVLLAVALSGLGWQVVNPPGGGVGPGNGGAAQFVTPNLDAYLLPWGPNSTLVTGTAMTANRYSAYQFYLMATVTFTKMTTFFQTASAGGKFGFAIYGARPSTSQPAMTPLLVYGIFPTDSSGVGTSVTVPSTRLTPGTYWMVWVTDNGVATVGTASSLSGTVITYLWPSRAGTMAVGWDGATFPASFSTTAGNLASNPALPPFMLLQP